MPFCSFLHAWKEWAWLRFDLVLLFSVQTGIKELSLGNFLPIFLLSLLWQTQHFYKTEAVPLLKVVCHARTQIYRHFHKKVCLLLVENTSDCFYWVWVLFFTHRCKILLLLGKQWSFATGFINID